MSLALFHMRASFASTDGGGFSFISPCRQWQLSKEEKRGRKGAPAVREMAVAGFFSLFFFFSFFFFSRRPGGWGKGGRRPILLPVAAREIGKERGGDGEEGEEESGDSFFFLLRRNLCFPCCSDIKRSV